MKKRTTKNIFKSILFNSFKVISIAIIMLTIIYSLHIIDDRENAEETLIIESEYYDVSLRTGEMIQLTPTEDIIYDKLTWQTENENGLTVSASGIITAKKPGTYTVTCTYQKKDKVKETEEFWICVTK